jgi:heme A synthase
MQGQNPSSSASPFWRLAFVTTLLTLGLIVFGAVVRVTDSGLGCGNDWPLCNGSIFPPLDNLTAWIEWSHRLFALLIGLLGIVMLVAAWRKYRSQNKWVLGVTIAAAGMYAAQAGLGRSVVKEELSPTLVTLHLGLAMLLMATLLTAGLIANYKQTATYSRDHVTTLIYINTLLSLVIILTGALVRGSGATLACVDWPLCNGEIFPFGQGQPQVIHVTHRFAVVGLGVTLLLLVWYVYQNRRQPSIRRLAFLSLGAYLSQVAVGALFVFSEAHAFWGAAHVGIAATTWGLLVALSVIETLNSRVEAGQGRAEWTQPSEAASK